MNSTNTEGVRTDARQVATSFTGHETFVFRYGWLKKAVDGIHADPGIFGRDDALVKLGVGKNMVRSIRHWSLATGVLEETPQTRGMLRVSTFGKFLFGSHGKDPFLEDANSLWLLHWNLATNEQRSTTWSWAFNAFPAHEFNRDAILVFLQMEIQRRGHKPANESSLKRDIDCFIRTYVSSKAAKDIVIEDSLDCPLVELGLIEERRDLGLFTFRRGSRWSISDEVFAYCLLQYWDRIASKRETLAFSDVAYSYGSPGTVLKLDEDSLAERLERLEQVTHGELVYGETAGLKQIYRRGKTSASELLERHYEQTLATLSVGA